MAVICFVSMLVITPLGVSAANNSVKEVGGVTIQNVKTKQYLNYDYGTLKNGTPLRVWPWDGSKEQLFAIDMVSAGTYRILTNASANFAVDVYRGNSKLKAGQQCDIWKAGSDSIAQNIQFYDCGDGSFILRMSNNTNLALAATSAKGRIKLVNFNKNDNSQKWIFKDTNGNKIDITNNSTSVTNPLCHADDYRILNTIKFDSKEYWVVGLNKKIGNLPANTIFCVDASTKNIIVDKELVSQLLVADKYLIDIANGSITKDIENIFKASCDYIDKYTDIKGCGMIGSLVGKGCSTFLNTWVAVTEKGQGTSLKNCAESWGELISEAAGVDERIDIYIVLYFAKLCFNTGLEALYVASENYISPTEIDYDAAIKTIEYYSQCKYYFEIIKALTKDTIDEYNQTPWWDKILNQTYDALEGLMGGVTGDLSNEIENMDKLFEAMEVLDTLQTMSEMQSYSNEILNALNVGTKTPNSIYKQTKSKYIIDATTIINNSMIIANMTTLEYWDSLIGTTVASIKSGNTYTKWYGSGNVSAKAGYYGQCTWYALGRFYEITGVKLTTAPHAKYWLTKNANNSKVKIIYGASNIMPQSIAVDDDGTYGHVMFIEYVTYDANGKPNYVYFTECNWDSNGKYNVGKDCIVQKMTYNNFIKYRTPDGYIIAK